MAETLPKLPDADFAKTKRMLQQPETLTFLDEVQRKLAALPVPAEVRQAAVRQEGLRRRPELLQGESPRAAALRGVLLMCAVVLAKAGDAGQQAVGGVQKIFRNTWRASSLVECINSVLRMQQARHQDEPRSTGPETALLELPRVPLGAPSGDFALPTARCGVAGRATLVGCAQMVT